MSFEIKKIYTDNPYVDEMVYYTRKLGIDTVLKMQDVADRNETVQSIRNGELYISCIEGTAIFEIFPSVTATALYSAGIIAPEVVERCIKNKDNVPISKRDAVTKAMVNEYIENYDDLNPYYRMLNGKPPIYNLKNGLRYNYDTIKDYAYLLPDNVIIDIDKPIHEMNKTEASLLDKYGIIDAMIDDDPTNRQYMRHIGDKKIDYYTARRANRFDPLYIPKIDSDAIYKMYKDKLDANKFYVLRTVYSEAFKYNSDYYDNFIAIFIVLITVIDIISRVQEFIARKEIFDIRSVQYIFKSYGVPFFEEIPLKYQIAMVKNLHTLLKYKSTKKCMVDICSLFGFKNIQIFKYYLLRDRKIDLKTGDYIYATDENGNEDLEAEYELKFLKLPLEDDIDNYIKAGANYVDYDEITSEDKTWDGGLEHNDVMKSILEHEFNLTRTKYISIDSIYDIAKMSAQQTYFFNFLYDNVDYESLLTIQVPYIQSNTDFNVADIFTLLTALTYQYRGIKDTIMDTQSKVLYVNGFNFKADLATLAEEIGAKKINGIVVDPGSTLHAQEQLAKFIIPKSSIPSFGEMMDIYINNMEVRDELIKGMQESDNMKVYSVYKKLYDALMTVQLTMDYYKNPETGDFYRDSEGDATYSEFLKNRDPVLYSVILEAESFDDQASKNQYIALLIDSIIYALEEYIDTEEFQALFSNLPVVSSEVVKQYIATVINFYKSYKVDFLGINTIYILDDKNNCLIRLIDDMKLNRFFQKSEFVHLYEQINKLNVSVDYDERVKLIERIYLDISTWVYKNYETEIDINDKTGEIIISLILKSIIEISEKVSENNVSSTLYENILLYDYPNIISTLVPEDDLGIIDRLWIHIEGESYDNFMNRLSKDNAGDTILASASGDSAAGLTITEEINPANEEDRIPTTEAIDEYLQRVVITEDDIVTSGNVSNTLDDASDEKVISEKALYEQVQLNVLKDD